MSFIYCNIQFYKHDKDTLYITYLIKDLHPLGHAYNFYPCSRSNHTIKWSLWEQKMWWLMMERFDMCRILYFFFPFYCHGWVCLYIPRINKNFISLSQYLLNYDRFSLYFFLFFMLCIEWKQTGTLFDTSHWTLYLSL